MSTATVKITAKGQITIPRKIREHLKSETICFDIKNNDVVLRPVGDAAGALHKYARNNKAGADFKKVKAAAWENAVREKNKRKHP
jgi:AbrB family looped-hinge helix DNA binding protein